MGRRGRVAAGALAVTVLVAGCAAPPKAGPSTFAARPGSGASAGLAARLETPPADSRPGTSDWAVDYTPSLGQYVAHLYDPKVRAKVTGQLREQGLRQIAHVLWVTDDDVQCDIVLTRFADAAGAAKRLGFVISTNAQDRSRYTVDAPGRPVVYYDDDVSQDGFRSAKGYARVGDVVVELFVYANVLPQHRIRTWLTAQTTRLA